ncbi:site-specific integrase [Aliarcobacter butzleri]|uniref:site-specific integrase n=1 Tax=Aliarcobacter butzleri TaxID=28197 RepID=UPI001EDB8F7B|nr:site-specific integrase [Aliarcobacter butzleri]
MSQTRNGVQFDPNEEQWRITDSNKQVNFNFNRLKLKKQHKFSLKNSFKWYLENHSLTHAHNMFEQFVSLFSFFYTESTDIIKEISDVDLINYRGYLGKEREWYIGSLSGFLKKWYKMGDSCLTKEAYGYLQEIKLKGNIKGEAVATMDPYDGPFTDLELELIQTAINNSYAKNRIKTDEYILVWLFMIYGSRPIQFAQMKIKDVISVKQNDNSYEVFINIPRAKNRKAVRTELKKRLVPKAFSNIFFRYSQEVKMKIKGTLPNINEAPLFLGNNLIDNDEYNYEMKFHLTSAQISSKIDNVFNKLKLKSERTNDFMHIIPIRFRRTIGTRAAVEGHGSLIIAEILDHTDTQNAQVYVESRPEIIERIDRAIALHMAPIAQAFAGTLVKDKSKAIRANDLEADIINPAVDKTCTPSGKCGSYSFCGQMSPLACYTCSSFQAWLDGPHEAVLQHLLNERERLLKVTDYRIASINDKTILAVAQVVKACQKYKEQNGIEVFLDAAK